MSFFRPHRRLRQALAILTLSATAADAASVAYQGFDNSPNVAALLTGAGHTVKAMTPGDVEEGDLVAGGYDVFVMSRNSVVCDGPDSTYALAVQAFVNAGGNVVTEWIAGPMFFTADDDSVTCGGDTRLATFAGTVHAGETLAFNTPIDLLAPAHPLFDGIPDPMADGTGTEFMFWIENPDPRLTVLGEVTGAGGAFPAGQQLPVVMEGCHGRSRFLFGLHDWNDTLASSSISQNFLLNAVEYAAEGCDPCPAVPASGCLGGSASVAIKNDAEPGKDSLKWKMGRGDAFDHASLGDPASTRSYALCVYDETGGAASKVASLVVAPGSLWLNKDPKGFKFADKTGTNAGVIKVGLKPGEAGKSGALFAAKGIHLELPDPINANEFFDQDTRVIVQLVNDETAECMTSEFTSFKANTAAAFKAATQ